MAVQPQSREGKKPGVINGVNITQLAENIRMIKSDGALAEFQFRVHNRWEQGGQNTTTVNAYSGTSREFNRSKPFALQADEPPVLLGSDAAPNPVEYLLAALSSCMTTSLAYHAAAQGITVESISSEYEGDIDMHGFLDLNPNVRKGYREIRVKFRVRSDADAEKLKELAMKSPVLDVVSNPTPVRITVEKE